MGSSQEVDRCPRCKTRADATAHVEWQLPPGERDALARWLDIIQHELGIETEAEALVEAARSLAFSLNQG